MSTRDWYLMHYRSSSIIRGQKNTHASAARYPMSNCDVIDIGLHVIEHSRMYAEEYKKWTLRKNTVLPIIKTIDSFKEYWAGMIALINQMAVSALQHGCGMIAVDDDTLLGLYSNLLANFGAAYAAMQETMKSQTGSLVAMQGQLANI